MDAKTNIILIAGPTASGKSQLALTLAAQQDSVIINTDSMQVYADLCLLTARPMPDEMNRIPHYLYGFVDGAQSFSVGHWLACVRDLLEMSDLQGKTLIFVGGTGLYFRAFSGGLAHMPKIPEDIRNFWRKKLQNEGASSLHAVLSLHDPLMAGQLRPSDGQRIVRALEVVVATGKSLKFWQTQKTPSLIDRERVRKIILLPEREVLYDRINRRLEDMIQQGALAEVERLVGRLLDVQLPVMKAIGVREFCALLRGEINRHQALSRAQQETRRYAKRQISWFRNQMKDENWQIMS